MPDQIRFDVTVVEDSGTYTGTARVMPDGRIGVIGKSRHMLPTEAVIIAVRKFLSQHQIVA
ncbi:MAG: hypothetical protein OXC18_02260 [Desulfurellaceae bacterium]|nr:hypothetical protein [Desulfurellaceae bacterium]